MIECEIQKCCGCSACVQVCPKRCISLCENSEGFSYPQINKLLCINCHLCEKVCPYLNVYKSQRPIIVYAAKNRDEELRLQSSSGGIFSLLAEAVIKKGGVVFGACFDENGEVKHGYTETMERLALFRGSKYMQSRIGDSYKKVQILLKQGRTVLFTGSPCQVAGLKHFLCQEYDNLLTVDFACHGVPSPKVWRIYLDEKTIHRGDRKEQHSSHYISLKKKISKIDFRSKSTGWKRYSLVLTLFEQEGKENKNIVLFSSVFTENSYMQAFLSNLILRPSCYNCLYKNGVSHSDITLADFWGVGSQIPEFDDDKGVSVVLISSKKGEKYYDKLNVDCRLIELEDAKVDNNGFKEKIIMPRNRSLFFSLINEKGLSVDKTTKRCLEGTMWRRIARRIKKMILKKIQILQYK